MTNTDSALLRDTAGRDLQARQLLLVAAVAWCVAVAAAPIFESRWLYAFFSAICHQSPARSWHLAGEPLGVCIRCTSIYVGFLLALALHVPPHVRFLQISLFLTGLQFIVAQIWIDPEATRALSGLLLGAGAAGFVERGVWELWAGRARNSLPSPAGRFFLTGHR